MKINPVNVTPVVTPRTHQVSPKPLNEGRVTTASSSVNDVTEDSPRLSDLVVSEGEPILEPNQSEDDKLLAQSVDQANQTLKMYDRKLEMAVHEVTKTVMYTLRDTKTNEVIMEFPPKKIQDMIAKMWELAGLFVDKKA